MIVCRVEMFSGLAGPERYGPGRGPLRQVTSICGLTLQGGVEQDLAEPRKAPSAISRRAAGITCVW